ncbi:MAG TPA: hypothetical protein VGA70_04665 [Longimicrobiales bacterium]
MLAFILLVVWLGAAASALLWGLDYYVLPLEERAFSPLAPVFAPTGAVGHGLGVVGTAMIVVGVAGYSARRRMPLLRSLGALKQGLQVHIFLCTLGPLFVLLHTSFKFGGLVSVAFWSMAVVVASGLFGRYVYVRIPKTLNGRFLEVDQVQERIRELSDEIRARVTEVAAAGSGLPAASLDASLDAALHGGLAPGEIRAQPRGFFAALLWAVREDLRARGRERRLRRAVRQGHVPLEFRRSLLELARERARLRQQAIVLQPFQRLFRYWHVVHLPLAVVMFIILAGHIAVAVLFGYTWVWG